MIVGASEAVKDDCPSHVARLAVLHGATRLRRLSAPREVPQGQADVTVWRRHADAGATAQNRKLSTQGNNR
jgi:hypothetical protein